MSDVIGGRRERKKREWKRKEREYKRRKKGEKKKIDKMQRER